MYVDALTGIHNRRYFNENMARVLRSASRHQGEVSLLMVDIDFFKRYNDTYGHAEGDRCLRAVASVLANCVDRADDFVARYGGEEFVVVLPHTGESGARQIAGRLLDGVRGLNIPHTTSDAADRVTVSVGVAAGCAGKRCVSDDYVNRADEMLYRSKREGRNRYSFAMMPHCVET